MSIRKAYTDCGDGQIHYRHAEGDAGPIVMIPQIASSGAMYGKIMTALAGQYESYAIDVPGFGGSFDTAGPPSMEEYCAWVLEAIDKYRNRTISSIESARRHFYIDPDRRAKPGSCEKA